MIPKNFIEHFVLQFFDKTIRLNGLQGENKFIKGKNVG